jgi:hypothetical protein
MVAPVYYMHVAMSKVAQRANDVRIHSVRCWRHREVGHESRVSRAGESVAQNGVDADQIAGQQCGRVKPKAGKHHAACDAVCVGKQPVEAAFAENEPVDCGILHAPDKVFADAIAAVGIQLRSKVVADGAGGHFGDELGCAIDVIIFINPGLSAASRIDQEINIGLRFVVEIEPDRRVGRRARPVCRHGK